MVKPVFKFQDHQWEAVTVPEDKVQIYSVEGIKRVFFNSPLDSDRMSSSCMLSGEKID